MRSSVDFSVEGKETHFLSWQSGIPRNGPCVIHSSEDEEQMGWGGTNFAVSADEELAFARVDTVARE